MKKFLLVLAIAASAQLSAFAQTYSFSKTTGTYADLTGATAISAANWDEDSYTTPIGFTFSFGNKTYTDILVNDNGAVLFMDAATQGLKGAFLAFEADLMDRGTTTTASTISYITSGSAGSQITKIEWKNAGFRGQSGLIANDFTNFQVWFYEGSNKIEVHMGSTSITPANASAIFGPSGGAATGLITRITGTPPTALTFDGYMLQGAAANPTLATVTGSLTYPHVTGIPTSGTIYTFNRVVSGVAKNLENTAVSVYPNPATDMIKITGLTKGNVTVKIHDALGKVVLTKEMAAANNTPINVSNLPKGTYFMEILSEEGRMGKQFIKQ